MVDFEQLALKHGIPQDSNTIMFAKEVYQLGRQSIFDAQKQGRDRVKAEGKSLGRPKGSKDKKKRIPINKYIYYLLKNRHYKLLSDDEKKELIPMINAVDSKKAYHEAKQQVSLTFSKSIFNGRWMNEIGGV